MVIPDVNILLYATDTKAVHHEAARAWWIQTLGGSEEVGLAWTVILGFIRLTTKRGIWESPLTVHAAIAVVRSWLSAPPVRIVSPGEDHARILFALLEGAGTGGNLTAEADLAALAMEYRARIASTDYDFSRFRKLRWFNPLA